VIARLPRVAAVARVMNLLLAWHPVRACGGIFEALRHGPVHRRPVDGAGWLAEMATTAQTLHLGLVLLTGFHLVRAVTVNALPRKLRLGPESSASCPSPAVSPQG
jgi:hypothetical protein